MDRQEIVDYLLDHYQRPRYRGALEKADVIMPGGNPGCGDVITIYLKIDEAGRQIAEMIFEGHGCTVSQVAASILAETMRGALLTQAEEMNFSDMMDMLGREVVRSRPQCATLALSTLKNAIRHYHVIQTKTQIQKKREEGEQEWKAWPR